MRAADVQLTRAFERGELPPGGFHHADHLRVAWVYLVESPTVDEAIARIEATLVRFTAVVGKPEKYSRATTVFWMHQMAAALAVLPNAECEALFRAYPRLLDKDLIRAAS
ncbi:MAG TPA: hypothetical protein VGH34_11315 [Vicinamibacterales bacterium]|jgi:hypothetical protein